MNFSERLRSVVGRGGSASRNPPYAPYDQEEDVRRPGAAEQQDAREADPADAAEILGGTWRASGGHRFLVVDRTYPPGHRLGRVSVAEASPADSGIWPTLPLLEPSIVDGRLLFIDLETTGLAGGAGTYAFLIGCGWFEPPSPPASAGQGSCFHVRQFVLTSFVAERALLADVSQVAGEAAAVITYNGKTFDLPLIETRFLLHRMSAPFSATPHVDMLHPARRLWSTADGSGRLTAMEEDVLGYVREDDVPGFEIPARYFNFVRSGDARPLAAVLEHNRLDLLSLGMLTARAAQLLDEGAAATGSAREALGLGRLYERAGMVGDARRCFERSASMDGAEWETVADALRALAVNCRRSRQHEAAATAWRRLMGVPGLDSRLAQEAAEALAIHHEHRVRDLPAARSFASLSLQHRASLGRVAALQYRLARLDRKLGSPAPLF